MRKRVNSSKFRRYPEWENEIDIYIDNTQPIFNQKQNLFNSMAKHKARGKYDRLKAIKGLSNFAGIARTAYNKEMFPMFPKAKLSKRSRWKLGYDMEKKFSQDYWSYNKDTYLKKKRKK
jgi:hypothetical protein